MKYKIILPCAGAMAALKKDELAAICKVLNIPAGGTVGDLTIKIRMHLHNSGMVIPSPSVFASPASSALASGFTTPAIPLPVVQPPQDPASPSPGSALAYQGEGGKDASDDDDIKIISVRPSQNKKRQQLMKEMMKAMLTATEEDDEEEESVKFRGGGGKTAPNLKAKLRSSWVRETKERQAEQLDEAKDRLKKILAKRNAEKQQDEDPKLDEESDVEKFIEKLQQKQIQEDFFATHVKVNFRGGGMKTSREEKGTSSSSAIAAGEEDSYNQKVLYFFFAFASKIKNL